MPRQQLPDSATCIPRAKGQKQFLSEALCAGNRGIDKQSTYKIGATKSYDFPPVND